MHALRMAFATQAAIVAQNLYVAKALLNHIAMTDVMQSHYIRCDVGYLRGVMRNVEDKLPLLWIKSVC